MKQTILFVTAILSTIGSFGQGKVYTYRIQPDTTIIIKVNKATHDTTVIYDIGNYFQFELAGISRDSFTVKWSTIRAMGEGVKSSGYQNLPMSLITLVGQDSITIANLNSVLQNWGIVAIAKHED